MRPVRLLRNLLVALAAIVPAHAQTVPPDAPAEARAADAAPVEVRVSDRVVLVRDPSMRSVQFTLVVRAGCADEPELRCRGLAHYLEHLILAGRGSGHDETASRLLPEGTSNGWTSHRATAYVHRVPKRATVEADLERLFAFYAARLQGFEVAPDDAARERNVVLQEHNLRVAGNPIARFQARLDALLLPGHPLGQSVGGTPESIQALTVEDARAFHRTWYSLSNAYVLVAGDVSELALKGIVERTLGGLPDAPPPERAWRAPFAVEPLDLTIRETDAAVRRRAVVASKIVRLEDADPALRPARALLASFLRSQLPGSPHDVLVERANVTDAVGFADVARLVPGVYRATIAAEPHEDADPERLAEAIRAYWRDLADRGIDERNLERLKRRFEEGEKLADRQGERIFARLVDWIGMGNEYDTLGVWPRRVAAVTVADVNRLVRAMAEPGRAVTGILTPPASGEASP